MRHGGEELTFREVGLVGAKAGVFGLARARLELGGALAQRIGEVAQLLLAVFGLTTGGLLGGNAAGVLKGTLLGRTPFGEVARDLAEADELARAVAQRGDQHVRPERRAILPDAPAFLLVLARPRGDLQLAGGLVGGEILGEIELREVLPDDLLGAVLVDPLGRVVPRGHPAGGVEHEDGIVLHAIDEETEALLALAQRFLRLTTLRQVARDLAEADQLPRRVAQRGDDHVRPEARTVLADAPSLVFEASGVRRRPELEFGKAFGDEIARVEDGEVLADDLVGRVALEALRAAVPAEDVPLGIEREDGVVAHVLDEQAVQLRRLLRGHTPGACFGCTRGSGSGRRRVGRSGSLLLRCLLTLPARQWSVSKKADASGGDAVPA